MWHLNYQLKELCEKYPADSYATQRDRTYIMALIANQLREAGYNHLRADGLKGRHVNALVERWQRENLSSSTLKNRMSALRWWARKVGRQSVITRTNDRYGIPGREYVTNISKTLELKPSDLEKVNDPYVRMSLRLQQAFGLRREEAIKFRPAYADRGDRIKLKASWTKGGRAREIPVRTEAQRALLDEAHRMVGRGALIPPDLRYVDQMRRYEHQTKRAGLSRPHGLRHAYAVQRYQTLTGYKPPAAGGPRIRNLTAEQKSAEMRARLTISRELGHVREEITRVYLGK